MKRVVFGKYLLKKARLGVLLASNRSSTYSLNESSNIVPDSQRKRIGVVATYNQNYHNLPTGKLW
jgi:hypothetical protein